jgi:hypothetical protein
MFFAFVDQICAGTAFSGVFEAAYQASKAGVPTNAASAIGPF